MPDIIMCHVSQQQGSGVMLLSVLCTSQVFDDPKKKRNLILVLGVTLGLFIIYLLAQRARNQ